MNIFCGNEKYRTFQNQREEKQEVYMFNGKGKINPCETFIGLLSSENFWAVIDENGIKADGGLNEEAFEAIFKQTISSYMIEDLKVGEVSSDENVDKIWEQEISNFKSGDLNKEKTNKKHKGAATNLTEPKQKKEWVSRPKSWEVWRVDFPKPVGSGEFAFPHYALVLAEGDDPNSYVVFPSTSKYRDYNSIYRIKFTEENMNYYDEDFIKKSKETFFMFNKQDTIDISRFQWCVGVIKEKFKGEILTAWNVAQVELGKKAIKNLDESQISEEKRDLSMENIKLTNKQIKVMEHVCSTDIFSIANNMNYTYERRVNSLVGAFGLPVTGDGEFLIDFIKRIKAVSNVNADSVMHAMSRRKNKPYKVIREKLNTMMRKRFKMDDTVLIEFSKLINVLAG